MILSKEDWDVHSLVDTTFVLLWSVSLKLIISMNFRIEEEITSKY